MGWRFRQSFKILPGLKLNLSKTGLSVSIGGAPFTVNLGQRGVYETASIPGSGMQFRQRVIGDLRTPVTRNSNEPTARAPNHFGELDSCVPALKEIRSASNELLTSEGLKEFKSL